jgi:hypothetical protein
MPGASEQTRRIKIVNANWIAGPDGDHGRFEVMLIAFCWAKCGTRAVADWIVTAIPMSEEAARCLAPRSPQV